MISTVSKSPAGLPYEKIGMLCNYMCDTAADVADLPTTAEAGVRPGSMALIMNNGSGKQALYILNNSRVWVLLCTKE